MESAMQRAGWWPASQATPSQGATHPVGTLPHEPVVRWLWQPRQPHSFPAPAPEETAALSAPLPAYRPAGCAYLYFVGQVEYYRRSIKQNPCTCIGHAGDFAVADRVDCGLANRPGAELTYWTGCAMGARSGAARAPSPPPRLGW